MKSRVWSTALLIFFSFESICEQVQKPTIDSQRHTHNVQNELRALFSSEIPASATLHQNRDDYKRSRVTKVEGSWIPSLNHTQAQLFDDATVDIEVTDLSNQYGSTLVRGMTDGDVDSHSILSSYDGALSGMIYDPSGRRFLIFPSPDGNHVIAELNPKVPFCSTEQVRNRDEEAKPREQARFAPSNRVHRIFESVVSAGTNIVIDVMILFSSEAKQQYTEAGCRSLAVLNVGYLNSVFVNNKLPITVRLVYFGESPIHIQKASAQLELGWLSANKDVKELKQRYGADLVSEIAYNLGGVAAYLDAFSIVDNSPETFAHEVGHNFGARHNVEHVASNSNCPSCPDFAYGYHFTDVDGTEFGTLMSYVGLRIPYFSSPDISWKGNVIGNAETADNSRAIQLRAATVAAEEIPQIASFKDPRFDANGFAFDLTVPPDGTRIFNIEFTDDYQTWNSFGRFVLTANAIVADTSVNSYTRRRFYRAKEGNSLVPNQVGFIRKAIPTGDSMIGNQLDSGDNRISRLWPKALDGMVVSKYDNSEEKFVANTFSLGTWTDPEMTLSPGEGVVVSNPGPPTSLTFVGHVWQSFNVHLPSGYSIVCSPVPQTGALSAELAFPLGQSGNYIQRMLSDKDYTTYMNYDGTWKPNEPIMEWGEAFWVFRYGWIAGNNDYNNWSRIFWTWP